METQNNAPQRSSGLRRYGPLIGILVIAAIVLLIFNTGSIANMVRHYGHDKERIYCTDIRHLDAGR